MSRRPRPSSSSPRPPAAGGSARALLARLEELAGARPLRVWAHGELPGSAELARGRGYERARVLLQMRRPSPASTPTPAPRSRRASPCPLPAGHRRGRLAARSTPAPSPPTRSRAGGPGGRRGARGRGLVRPGRLLPRLAGRAAARLALDQGAPGRGDRRRADRRGLRARHRPRRAGHAARPGADRPGAGPPARPRARRRPAVRRGGQHRRRRAVRAQRFHPATPSTSPGGATPHAERTGTAARPAPGHGPVHPLADRRPPRRDRASDGVHPAFTERTRIRPPRLPSVARRRIPAARQRRPGTPVERH